MAKYPVMQKIIAEKIRSAPKKPGVYMFKDVGGRIVYVGKAVDIKKRTQQHFRNTRNHNSPKLPFMLRGGVIADIDWIQTKNESQAMLLENQLIKKYQPRYNIQWRDDKSYFWVRFTDDAWPRVIVVHKNKLKHPPCPPLLKRGVGGDFIGPFVSGRELRKTLRAFRKIFPFRTCKNLYEKPCLQWHLGLCPAHGTSDKWQVARDRLKKYINSLNGLLQFLRLYAGEKIRIEAYDISNIQGKYATGSMIVFHSSKPGKSDYRRFRIKTVSGANDAAMMREVIGRRLGHPEWPHPDLMLIDGGLAQLRAATSPTKVVKRSLSYFSKLIRPIPKIALAKQEEEIYTEYSDRPLKISSLPESLGLMLKAIRDEAHRFAIFYYRYLHEKREFGKSHAEIRKSRRR